jgi:plasmid stabilization system protein ParE
MAEIRWTEEAQHWLRDIHDYIVTDNPDAAAKVITGIYDKAQVLRRFPEIGHKYRTEVEGDIRILLYGHYRIAYLLELRSA